LSVCLFDNGHVFVWMIIFRHRRFLDYTEFILAVLRRRSFRFLGISFPLAVRISPQATDVGRFDGYGSARLCGGCEAEQPPRRCSRHVDCIFAAVGVSRFDPRPEGEGAGVQNARRGGSRWSPPARAAWVSVCVGVSFSFRKTNIARLGGASILSVGKTWWPPCFTRGSGRMGENLILISSCALICCRRLSGNCTLGNFGKIRP
jgi:hypothetical protein